VLEIVWFYLYSGREQQARQELAGMWPAADYDRIRTALLDARGRGILAETDGASLRPSRWFLKKRKSPYVFDEANERPQGMVDLVIDVAGKVRSAKSAGSTSKDLLNDAAGWNFIPAFKNGHPVASRMRLQVGYLQ
jgi:hypothetical protein